MLMVNLLMVASLSGTGVVAANSVGDHVAEIESWRAQRVERLTSAGGWLSLIGLEWIKPGKNTIGSAKDNDIVIARAPARLGTIEWKDDRISATLAPGAAAMIDGQLISEAPMLDDSHEKPTVISFGSVNFHLIDRGGKKGLRIKDTDAKTRTGFLGIDYFPVDPAWRVEAKWIAFEPAQTIGIPNVLGVVEQMKVPGKAVFEHDGETIELLPVLESEDATDLFFIIADKTSGKQTYGGGRFIYTDMPRDGKLVIDFNKAYNPPCAFTPFATCPLAPPENRMKVAVDAGEKNYRGSHH